MEILFTLTDIHREFRASLRKFAEDRVAPNAAAADRDSAYPQASLDACRELSTARTSCSRRFPPRKRRIASSILTIASARGCRYIERQTRY
jgi:alkylation response protein AidB-like acyl-CoA dehydrogenase